MFAIVLTHMLEQSLFVLSSHYFIYQLEIQKKLSLNLVYIFFLGIITRFDDVY